MLQPLNREWISPSIVWGEVALCRDDDGQLWFCAMRSEAEGWEKLDVATAVRIQSFRWTQRLAGKEPQPWPAATVRDYEVYKDRGASPDSATSECIGRYQPDAREAFGERAMPKRPCNYAGYGLFRLSPLRVLINGEERHAFAFAEASS